MPSAIDEVVRQHVFIEAWMAGTTTDEAEWQQFADVLDDEFVIVPPTGTAQSKPDLLERFHAARGVAPDVRVEIRNAQLVHVTDEVQVVRYEEWQLHDERGNQRVSLAVFAADPSMPCGWRWLALHETALPV